LSVTLLAKHIVLR